MKELNIENYKTQLVTRHMSMKTYYKYEEIESQACDAHIISWPLILGRIPGELQANLGQFVSTQAVFHTAASSCQVHEN